MPIKFNTMKKHSFLKDLEQENVWVVINTSAIEKIRRCDVYGGCGQQCGHVDAGDYIDLNPELAELANNWEAEQESSTTWTANDYVSAYENTELFDYLVEQGADTEGEEIVGFHYHDGSNFRTIALEQYQNFPLFWEIETDDSIIRALTAALAAKTNGVEKAGHKTWTSKKYRISQSYWQGSWEKYTIEKL